METTFWISMFTIVLSDLLLSGDNAVVIGMAARRLPNELRRRAILIGSGIAVVLRASLTTVATYLLHIPFLMTAGGLLLFFIAGKLVIGDANEKTHVEAGGTFRSAIKTIIIADVVMSLDNVMAVAGAAHGNVWLVLFGLALSIPLLMWGSGFVARFIAKFPFILYLGGAVLGYIAGDLIIHDPWVFQYVMDVEFLEVLPYATAILILLFCVPKLVPHEKR
ncbi:TerC family protein [Shimazuella alba]|uniref:YjbE family putative metal transport protein n=1 Tax=Shimazuella alba TaxID=2690964 RepID=A0A6I4VT55_9BACL|nr:TerC family protein [Shimazuella alba]MXQ53658.1 YjbE family putative metal transport protein [Shimazuella alba]